MTVSQLLSLLFVVTAYVVFVVFQLTAGERWTGSLPRRAATFRRIKLSIVHGLLGYLAVATVGAYLNIQISGDYRHGLPGYYGFLAISWVVFALFIPWLGLLRNKRGEGN